jgi:hypothetical protein
MRGTVRFADNGRRAAEEEITTAGIADWPSAGMAVEIEKRSALRRWNIRVDAGIVGIGPDIDHPRRKEWPFPIGALAGTQVIGDRMRGRSAISHAGGTSTAPGMRAHGDEAKATNLSKHGIPADPGSELARNPRR